MINKDGKFKIRLVYKITSILTLLLILAIGIQTYLSVNYERDILVELMMGEGFRTSSRIVTYVELWRDDVAILKRQMAEEMPLHRNVVFYRIIDPSGMIYLSSNESEVGMFIGYPASTANETIVQEGSYGGEAIKIFTLPTLDDDILFLGLSTRDAENAVNEMLWKNLQILFFLVLGSLIFSYILANSVIIPIKKLTEGAEEIMRGNLDYRINIKTRDEIGRLAMTFNQMAVELRESRAQLEEYNKTLEGRVGERTGELNKKVVELNDARTAALNLLEDMDRARAELEGSYDKLREADKLKDEFMNIAAHELKTPLVPIMGYVNMMRDGSLGSLSQEVKDSLEIIYRNVGRLRKLIEDILDISKLESGAMKFEMGNVRVEEIINNSVQDMQSYAGKKQLTIEAELQPDLPRVYGDKNRLMQVLTDLIDNALKFTEKGGVFVEARREGDDVLIGVRDTGIGISGENIGRLFHKFYQIDSSLSRRYGGTGLGLAICRKIIEVHGGRIWVESEPGKGSVFKFTLPVKK